MRLLQQSRGEEYHKSLKPQCQISQVADAYHNDTDQSLLCSAMCVCEVGSAEGQDEAEPLRLEVKDLCVDPLHRLRRVTTFSAPAAGQSGWGVT